jgi:hypothetical protein
MAGDCTMLCDLTVSARGPALDVPGAWGVRLHVLLSSSEDSGVRSLDTFCEAEWRCF